MNSTIDDLLPYKIINNEETLQTSHLTRIMKNAIYPDLVDVRMIHVWWRCELPIIINDARFQVLSGLNNHRIMSAYHTMFTMQLSYIAIEDMSSLLTM